MVVLNQHVWKMGNPIRLVDLKLSCDMKVISNADRFCTCTVQQKGSGNHMTVRLNYAIYTHMLIQHNQEIGRGIPDPPSCGGTSGSGNETNAVCMTFTHHTNSYTMACNNRPCDAKRKKM